MMYSWKQLLKEQLICYVEHTGFCHILKMNIKITNSFDSVMAF